MWEGGLNIVEGGSRPQAPVVHFTFSYEDILSEHCQGKTEFWCVVNSR